MLNGWRNGAIDRTNHAITLKEPFSLANHNDPEGIFRVGHKVSRTSSGGSYQYVAGSNVTAPTEWTKVEGTQGGFGIKSYEFPKF